MRWRAGRMHVMRLHVPTEFVLVILWTTFRGVYEL